MEEAGKPGIHKVIKQENQSKPAEKPVDRNGSKKWKRRMYKNMYVVCRLDMLFVDISGICSREVCAGESRRESAGVRTSKCASKQRIQERIKRGGR